MAEVESNEQGRHHGEVSMQSFIKHQMRTILQPLQDDVHALSDRVTQLAESLNQTDTNVASTKQALDTTNMNVHDLRSKLNDAMDLIGKEDEGLITCVQNHEMLQKGLELTNHFAQRIHNQSENLAALVQELQNNANTAECEMQAVRSNLQRTNDYVAANVASMFDQMGSNIRDLEEGRSKASKDIEQLKGDLDQSSHFLNDTRKVLDKNIVDTTSLKKSVEAVMNREANLGARVEEWKHQWSKLHPVVESLRKDSSHFKQKTEHHDTLIHGLQQGNVDNLGNIESLQNAHEKLGNQVHTLRHELSTTEQGLASTQDGLADTTAIANSLQSEMRQSGDKLQAAGSKLDLLAQRHSDLCNQFEKANDNSAELLQDHKRTVSNMQTMQHELGKTNEGLRSVWDQIEATNANLHNVKDDLGNTNETMQKLKHGVDLCHAEFSGLQKGFMDTSTHITNRPGNLPKIAQEGDSEMSTASLLSSRRPSMSTEVGSRPRSINSVPMSGRRSSATTSPH